jgi:hypothetical protein
MTGEPSVKNIPLEAVWKAALGGFLGVALGFALFVFWEDKQLGGEPYWVLLLGLAMSTVLAYIFELLRSDAEGHTEEQAGSGFFPAMVLLALFELYILAAHTALDVSRNQQTLTEMLEDVFGISPGVPTPMPLSQVATMILLWCLTGMTLAIFLIWPIFRENIDLSGDGSQEIAGRRHFKVALRSAAIGAVSGGVVGPVCVAAYVVLAGGMTEFNDILTGAHQARYDKESIFGNLMGNMEYLIGADLIQHGPFWGAFWFGLALLFAAFLMVLSLIILGYIIRDEIRASRARKSTPPGDYVAEPGMLSFLWIVVAIAAFCCAVLLPLFGSFHSFLSLVSSVAFLWFLPGIYLGFTVPWLASFSSHPRVWGTIALISACVLMFWVRYSWWLVLPAIVLIAFGVRFHRGGAIAHFWPVLAVSSAIIVYALASVGQATPTWVNLNEQIYRLVRVHPAPSPPVVPIDIPIYSSKDCGSDMSPDPAVRQCFEAWDLAFGIQMQWKDAREKQDPLLKILTDLRTSAIELPFQASKPPEKELQDLEGRMEEAVSSAEHLIEANRETLRQLPGADRLTSPSWPDLDTRAPLNSQQLALGSGVRYFFQTSLNYRTMLETNNARFEEDSQLLRRVLNSLSTPHSFQSRIKRAVELQLTLTAGLGFWITLAILACWSVWRRQRAGPEA